MPKNKVLIFIFVFTLIFAFVQINIPMAQAKVTAIASSEETPELNASMAVDGNMNTRWSSQFSDEQWIEFDLGELKELVGIIFYWESAYGKEYDILLSTDKKHWEKVFSQREGTGGIEDIDFAKYPACYIKLRGKKRGTGWGHSLFEVVFKTEDEPFGIGQKEPDLILKRKWKFSSNPQKTIFIPESWEGQNTILLLSAIAQDYDLYVNENFVDTIKSSKEPARLNITKYVKPGEYNLFLIKTADVSFDNGTLGAMVLVKNSELDKLNDLRNSYPMQYYRLFADLYSEGYFPLWLNNKQDYWTLVGTEDSYEESLFSSRGTIGAFTGSFSLMPYLYINNKLITFNDVEIDLSLEDNYLPIPTVKWRYKGLDFSQKLFAYAKDNKSATYLIYRLKNNTDQEIHGKLFLAIRPFEVNPPWMHGGLVKINSIEKSEDNRIIKVNNNRGVISLVVPDEFGTSYYHEGDIILNLSKGKVPSKQSINDSSGYASASLAYNFKLPARRESEYLFIIPLDKDIAEFKIPDRKEFFRSYEIAKKKWEEKLNKIEIDIPEEHIVNVLRSNIAYILINKDGPALQPGSRSYENSWIRDGALISAALLRTSYPGAAKEYIEWISKKQLPSGEIPCIVNAKTNKLTDYAKDWKEYDASGEYVFAIADYYNFTKDDALVEETFPSVIKALKFIEELRATMLKEEYIGTPSYGILPEGHSHEGYLNNPQQSLWDDYWALKGWKDAQLLAKIANREDVIPWMKEEENNFRKCLLEDIKLLQSEKNIKYIPASIGLAEFDAISLSIALFPTFEYRYLDRDQINYSLNKYYNDEFLKRLRKGAPTTYIPYEIRGAHAFLILGEGDKALEMIRYFLKDLRPKEWNHWSEVVPADSSAPVYVGDMPHSWIGAIYINAVRSMFVYEENHTLILGSGIDEKWLKREDGISIKNLPTYFGKINYSVKRRGDSLKINIWGDVLPDEGFVFRSPFLNKKIKEVIINNKPWDRFSEREIFFSTLPAEIMVNY